MAPPSTSPSCPLATKIPPCDVSVTSPPEPKMLCWLFTWSTRRSPKRSSMWTSPDVVVALRLADEFSLRSVVIGFWSVPTPVPAISSIRWPATTASALCWMIDLVVEILVVPVGFVTGPLRMTLPFESTSMSPWVKPMNCTLIGRSDSMVCVKTCRLSCSASISL